MSNQMSRITFDNYTFFVDGEPVSAFSPLNAGATQSPFYYDEPAREVWLSYEVVNYATGCIYYAQGREDARMLAEDIARSELLYKVL